MLEGLVMRKSPQLLTDHEPHRGTTLQQKVALQSSNFPRNLSSASSATSTGSSSARAVHSHLALCFPRQVLSIEPSHDKTSRHQLGKLQSFSNKHDIPLGCWNTLHLMRAHPVPSLTVPVAVRGTLAALTELQLVIVLPAVVASA